MLSLVSPSDVQLEMSQFIKAERKRMKKSVEEFSELTGVPYSTIRKFEETGKISFPQFLMLYGAVGDLTNLQKLMKLKPGPKSLDEVLKNA